MPTDDVASPAPSPALRRMHGLVLCTLATCALALSLQEPGGWDAAIPPGYGWLMVVLAGVAVITRRAGEPDTRRERSYAMLSLACAAGLGLLGLALGLEVAAAGMGLMHVLAGALLALRPRPRKASEELEADD